VACKWCFKIVAFVVFYAWHYVQPKLVGSAVKHR
jgi:hypothetical protein